MLNKETQTNDDIKYILSSLVGRLMSPPPDRFRYDELNDTDFSPPRSPPGYAYKSKGSSSGSEWDRQTF